MIGCFHFDASSELVYFRGYTVVARAEFSYAAFIMTNECSAKPVAESTTEVDINDVFDDLLLVEERLSEESYQRGLQVGAEQGNVDAYHFGYHRGAEIGAELGFYYGVLCALEGGCRKRSEETPTKGDILLTELKGEIDEFPKFNDLEVDLLERLMKIRNKYKKLCSLLKVSAKYPKPNELSF